MMPTRQILPAVGPRPPAISRLYLSIAFFTTAAQSTPSGTLMVLTVMSLPQMKRGKLVLVSGSWLADVC